MTKLLSQAFEKATKLSDELQDQLTREMLKEIEGESRWDETLANSQDKHEKMAKKAEREYREGRTKEMGFDEL